MYTQLRQVQLITSLINNWESYRLICICIYVSVDAMFQATSTVRASIVHTSGVIQ